ncbi:nucleolar protein 6 [Histomonas meleagridis]|uniref:nucleolar protein 6 n=1 Tax=Histomonas meleagridis TaxID=135588 RepID=UPI00355A8DAE|nr:nucleolar protein 6 [Histomonas meleagridis]KAH0806586.1 nucleolar protein 6 [Histomonas meleagridis]
MEHSPNPEHDLEIFDVILRIITQKPIESNTTEEITNILTVAYSDRAVMVKSWIERHIMVGIHLNPNSDFNRQIDQGPHPKSKEAIAFREFWGEKSTLRRFQDGALLESLEWGEDPFNELTLYALQKHFSSDVKVESAPSDVSPLFQLPGHQANIPSPLGAYDELVTTLRSLDLTVGITSTSPISPFLRNTSVFPYDPLNCKSPLTTLCPPSIKILVKLESSTAWPYELTPLLQYKIAVYIEIAKLLNEKGIQSKPHYEGVHILLHGFVFDLIAFHEDEMRHFLGSPHGDKVHFTEKVLVIHHSFISALCTRYPSFSDSVRTSIRWVRSKGVTSEALSQEAIECIVASIYTSEIIPTNPYTGFLRFLCIFASKQNVISINSTIPASDTTDLPLVIVAQHCIHSEFTRNCILLTKSVVSFLYAAASQSLKIAIDGRFSPTNRNLQRIFAIPTSHWHVKYFIDMKILPHNEFALFTNKRRIGMFEIKTKIPPELDALYVDFNPVLSLLKELYGRFGRILNFWYDELGGFAFGVSYSDELLKSKPLKEDDLNFAMMTDTGDICVDLDSIKQQIMIMGSNIIKNFEVSE